MGTVLRAVSQNPSRWRSGERFGCAGRGGKRGDRERHGWDTQTRPARTEGVVPVARRPRWVLPASRASAARAAPPSRKAARGGGGGARPRDVAAAGRDSPPRTRSGYAAEAGEGGRPRAPRLRPGARSGAGSVVRAGRRGRSAEGHSGQTPGPTARVARSPHSRHHATAARGAAAVHTARGCLGIRACARRAARHGSAGREEVPQSRWKDTRSLSRWRRCCPARQAAIKRRRGGTTKQRR